MVGEKQRALQPIIPPPPLPLRPISWALLPLQFTSQSGVNGDMLQHLCHCWVAVQCGLPRHPSNQGLGEQLNANSHCQPTSTSPSSEPCQGKVPARSSIGHLNKSQHDWQMEQEWLVTPSVQWRKKPALSLHQGKHTATFFHDPRVISKLSATSTPLRVRESQTPGQYDLC